MSKKNKRQGLLVWVRQLSFRTKVILAAVAVVVLGLVILGVVLLVIGKVNEDTRFSAETQARQRAATTEVQYENNINDTAKAAYQDGGAAKLEAAYDKAINAENDKSKKLKLIVNESQLLYAYNKTDQAIAVAKTADAVSGDKYLMADWLSKLYEDQRQFSQAAQYYTLAGKWASSVDNVAKLPKAYYDQQAARVSALIGAN